MASEYSDIVATIDKQLNEEAEASRLRKAASDAKIERSRHETEGWFNNVFLKEIKLANEQIEKDGIRIAVINEDGYGEVSRQFHVNRNIGGRTFSGDAYSLRANDGTFSIKSNRTEKSNFDIPRLSYLNLPIEHSNDKVVAIIKQVISESLRSISEQVRAIG